MRQIVMVLLGAALGSARIVAAQTTQDPPARVGRLSVADGAVSLFPAGATDWSQATLNYPLTTGDAVWADSGARAEIDLGPSAVRIGALTSLAFGELSDTVTQMRVDQGSIDVHLRYLDSNEVYEIDTPAGVISLTDEGHYRVDVTSDGRRATFTVRDGSGEIIEGNNATDVGASTSAVLIDSLHPPVMTAAIPDDAWENWADQRAAREDAVPSTDYVSRDMVGYEDLDDNGSWEADATLGEVWVPRAVPAGWAPYRFGRWVDVAPWGWTWIDDAPWGFAPFHYGRWTYLRGRWGWVPGAIQLRPAYAPGLVAWVSGTGGAGVGIGVNDIGWVPLAPGEPYLPPYDASPAYLRRVNFANVDETRVNFATIDVDRIRYANRGVVNAVTVVPRGVFTGARPVGRAAIAIGTAAAASTHATRRPVAGGAPVALPPRPVAIVGTGRTRRPPPRTATRDASAAAPWHPREGLTPAPALPARPRENALPAAPSAPPSGTPSRDRATRPAAGSPSFRPVPPAQPATPPPAPSSPPGARPSGPPSVRPMPPVQTPAPAQNNAPERPARPSGPPSARPAPPPQTAPPQAPRPAAADNTTAAWQAARAQLVQRQQQQAADLARKQQQAQAAQAAHGANPQLQKQQQQDKKALEQQQQRERDQLDKQGRKPTGH